MKRFTTAGAILVVALLPFLTYAYTSPGSPTGFVNDFAKVLPDPSRQTLEAKLTAFKQATGDEIAVVTIPTVGDDTIENYAVELFKEWGIGERGKDNGVLVLVAVNDHKMRIEVGYGLEGSLTDAQAYWINQNVMTPAFKNNDFAGGLNDATDAIIGAVKGDATIPSETPTTQSSGSGRQFDWVWLIFFAPMWLGSILARSKSWWAGGVLGGIAGIIIGFIYGFLFWGIAAVVFLIPAGLLFDYTVSKSYAAGKSRGRVPR